MKHLQKLQGLLAPPRAAQARCWSKKRGRPGATRSAALSLIAMLVASDTAHAQTNTDAGRSLLLGIPPMIAAIAATGPETITYGYDAKGRLIRVFRDSPIADVTTTYQFDRADNRTRLTTTGSLNPPPP